jgi:CRP/FNR family transcriptional regulator, cyclic AMP receptor protein
MNSTIRRKPYLASAETMQPCQIAFIPSERFKEMIGHFPEIAMSAAEVMSSACTTAYDQIRSLGLTGSAKEKLAVFLLDLAKSGRPGPNRTKVTIAMTHEQIAQILGATRETVTRQITALKKDGIIEAKGSSVTIKDQRRLEKLVTL